MAESFRRKKRNDILLILIVLIVALALWLFVHITADNGAWVVVSRDGQEIARYALDEDQSINIADESGTNLLVIAGGQADITEADCPDELCVHQPMISKSGQTLICLPHKLIVSIEGGEESKIDSIAK